MNNELREIILQIALEEYESGHSMAFSKESFNEMMLEDFGKEVGPEAFEFYAQCRNMGPSGFYLMYKDELDFSDDFKSQYGFDEEEEEITESLTEDINPTFDDKYEVQQVDKEGNKLDQFISFNTKDEAINFAKTLESPAQVVQRGFVQESLSPDGKVIWSNLDTLEEGLSREGMIAELKARGKNYNFTNYSDGQIYYMYQKEMNKPAKKALSTIPETDEFIETNKCPHCKHILTDNGECPVCDLGDEEERENHMLFLDESMDDVTFLTEDVLLETSRSEKSLNKGKIKDNKERLKRLKNLDKIIEYSIKNRKNQYYVDGQWIDHDTYTQKYLTKTVFGLIDNPDKLLNMNTSDPNFAELAKALDVVVRDPNGWIIRRGTEIFKPQKLAFNPKNDRDLEIKDVFKASDLFYSAEQQAKAEDPKQDEEKPKEEPAKTDAGETKEEPAVESPATETKEEPTAEEPKAEEPKAEVKADSWVTPQSIKTTAHLLSRRKEPIVMYYDAKGNLFDVKKITPENASTVFVDKEAKKSFLTAMEEMKANMAKRKANANKAAAIFGESLDDDISYDEIEDVELDEGLNTKEYDELMALAKEIGIKTGAEANRFIQDNRKPEESTLDTLRRYRDGLGDDFDLKECSASSPIVEEDELNDDVDSMSWFNA